MKPSLQPYKIKTIYAAIAVGEGEQEGHEGIFGVMTENGWMPMVFTNPEKLEAYKLELERIGRLGGVKVELRTFTA
jgi:hypothetical protein